MVEQRQGEYDEGDDIDQPQNDVRLLIDDIMRQNAESIVRLDTAARAELTPHALGDLQSH